MGAGRVFRKILGILLLVVFAACCYYGYTGSIKSRDFGRTPAKDELIPAVSQETPTPISADTPAPTETVVEETPEPTVDPNSPAGRAAALGLPEPPDIDITSWEYILANDLNPIGEYAPPELVTLEGQQFDSRIIDAMKEFVADTRAEGLQVYLSSGYRDYATQQYLFNRKVAQTGDGKDSAGKWIVLPPGTSEHQTGLACDITDVYYEVKDRSLENTAMYQWMSQHCQDYGFIVRYPDGREDVTGVMYEPWHFRYVGVDAATYIMENGLCLEEFLDLYQGE